MKFLFASDIHGSAVCCSKVLEAFEKEGADRLVLLGDLLYHGPRNPLPEGYDPPAVAAMLNGIREKILAVRGNCDSEVDQMVLKFPIMADYALLPVGTQVLFITHGHLYNEDQLPPLCDGDLLIHGHTHLQYMNQQGKNLFLNPGSVSLPKDGNTGYILLEGSTFSCKTFDGKRAEELTV